MLVRNAFLLPNIYTAFSEKYKNIMIYSQTEHSTEAHQHVANQAVDLAIVYTEHYERNVISKQLFNENMVFICHKDSMFAETQQLTDLIDANEVYAKWSSEYENWHKRQFPYFRRHKIVIGGAEMFSHFLTAKEDWAIVSQIIGEHITRNNPNFIIIPHPCLPIRTAYLLSHKYPKPSSKRLRELFVKELIAHLENNPNITIIKNS